MKNLIQKNKRRKKRGLKPLEWQAPIGYCQIISKQTAR